jgi:ABC-type protease/lipase transport system fused ATPase/permease subunit
MANKVLQFHSMSTLVLLGAIMVVVFAYDTLLGYARRLIISVVGARLDTKLKVCTHEAHRGGASKYGSAGTNGFGSSSG